MGSGSGAIGSVVDLDNREPRFESTHQENILELLSMVIIRNEKEAANGPFKNIILVHTSLLVKVNYNSKSV